MVPMIRHRNRLSIPFRFIIHTPRPDRIHVAPIGFRLRVHLRVPVNLGSGCQQEPCPLLLSQSQQIIGTQCPHFQCLDRQVKVIDRWCRGCKVEYVVDLVPEIDWFCDVMPQVCESIRIDVLDIPCISSYQIVNTNNLMPLPKQKIA